MRDTDAAYISALIDSVGTIKIEPQKDGEISLYVWITRSDFKVMEYLQNSGARVIALGEGQFRAKWKDLRACRLLQSVIRFSHEKREQMRVGIEFYEAKTSKQKEDKYEIPFRLRLKLLKKAGE